MRLPAAAMALGMLAALAFGVWATGCTGLSNDCELNLNCAPPPASAPECKGAFFSAVCDDCLMDSCCKELGECDDDGTCMFSCAFTVLPSPPECGKPPTVSYFDNLKKCMKTSCEAACTPKDQCNPVTNAGCMPDGSQCDVVFPGLFVCFQPFGTPAALCGACDNLKGPYCGPGLRCHAGSNTCGKYCCTDADCGTGRCELDPIKAFGSTLELSKNKVGVCVTMDGSAAACDAPATPASNGACFTTFQAP